MIADKCILLQSEDDLYARKLKTLSQYEFFSVSSGSEGSSITTGNVPVNQRQPTAAKEAGSSAPAPSVVVTTGKEPIYEYDRLKVCMQSWQACKKCF